MGWGMLDDINTIFDLAWLREQSVMDSLAQWKQADLVSGIRLFWTSNSGIDKLSKFDTEIPPDGGWSVVRWERPPPESVEIGQSTPETMAIITSQTCDVVATGPGGRHSTVQVSPVINLDKIDSDRATAVRNGRRYSISAIQV